jgi:hypothetical protein
MPNPRIRSLFHTLVVVGASVSACGGKSASSNDEGEATRAGSGGVAGSGGAGAGGTPSVAGTPAVAGTPGGGGAGAAGSGGAAGALPGALTCEATTQWHCLNYTTNEGCACDPSAPKSPADCESEFAFTCDGELYVMGGNALVGCSCLEDPLTPADCEHPEQFGCNHYFSYFAGCSCRPGAPLSAADCEDVWCSEFQCRSEVPRYGCSCENLGCIK